MGKITRKLDEKYYGFLFHYYRAEVYRETAWRNRLDVTTNWSILVTAAMLSLVFGNPGISHGVIIINYLTIWFFLYIEARRFRYYSLVQDRVKLFEKNILGNLFDMEKTNKVSDDWINELSDKLIKPKIKMSRLESLSWRLRRIYMFLFPFVYFVWVYKVSVSPVPASNVWQFFINARVGFISGGIVTFCMTATIFAAVYVAFSVSRKGGRSDLP